MLVSGGIDNKVTITSMSNQQFDWSGFSSLALRSRINTPGFQMMMKVEVLPWRIPTVDGSEIRRENQLRLVVYPHDVIYRDFLIPGGAGLFPSTVWTFIFAIVIVLIICHSTSRPF